MKWFLFSSHAGRKLVCEYGFVGNDPRKEPEIHDRYNISVVPGVYPPAKLDSLTPGLALSMCEAADSWRLRLFYFVGAVKLVKSV